MCQMAKSSEFKFGKYGGQSPAFHLNLLKEIFSIRICPPNLEDHMLSLDRRWRKPAIGGLNPQDLLLSLLSSPPSESELHAVV
jgi:hypothetical protein